MKEQSPCSALLQSRQIHNVQQKESERQSLHVMFNPILESDHQRFCYQSVGTTIERGVWFPKRKHGPYFNFCLFHVATMSCGCILLVSSAPFISSFQSFPWETCIPLFAAGWSSSHREVGWGLAIHHLFCQNLVNKWLEVRPKTNERTWFLKEDFLVGQQLSPIQSLTCSSLGGRRESKE